MKAGRLLTCDGVMVSLALRDGAKDTCRLNQCSPKLVSKSHYSKAGRSRDTHENIIDFSLIGGGGLETPHFVYVNLVRGKHCL